MAFSGCSIPAPLVSVSTTFLKNYCRGESLRTTTCHKTVFEGKQGHSPCDALAPTKPLFVSHISWRS